MPSTARTAACIALLLGLVGGLSGCGGSAEPSTMPSSSGSSTPSASPTGPVEPVLPEAAKADTKAGAVAFVKHYVKLYNYAQATGDVGDLSALGSNECVSCRDVVERITAIYEPGGSFEGGTWSVTQSTAVRSRATTWVVTVGGRIAPSVTQEAGKTPVSADGAVANVNFYLSFGQGWHVNQWKRF